MPGTFGQDGRHRLREAVRAASADAITAGNPSSRGQTAQVEIVWRLLLHMIGTMTKATGPTKSTATEPTLTTALVLLSGPTRMKFTSYGSIPEPRAGSLQLIAMHR